MKNYANLEGKTLYTNLLKKHKTWDNYSLAVIFLYILKLMSNEVIENDEIIKKFRFILLEIIMDNQKRNNAKETLNKMSFEFSTNKKESLENLGNKFKTEFTPEKFNQRTLLLAETKMKAGEVKA